MGLIARLCMNCNGRGNVPALDAQGRDTGRNRDCSYCEGCGEVVAYTAHRGAVDLLRELSERWADVRVSGNTAKVTALGDAVRRARELTAGGQ